MRINCKICWGVPRVFNDEGWTRVVFDNQERTRLIDARERTGALPTHDPSGWPSRTGAVPIIVRGASDQFHTLDFDTAANASLDELIRSTIRITDVVIVTLGHGYSVVASVSNNQTENRLSHELNVVSEYQDFSEYIENPHLVIGEKVRLSEVLSDGDRWVILGRRNMWRAILGELGINKDSIAPYWHQSLSTHFGFHQDEGGEFTGVCNNLEVLAALEPRLHADELECLILPENYVPLLKGPHPYGVLQASRYAVEISNRECVAGVFGTDFGYHNFFNIVTCRSLPNHRQKQLMSAAEFTV